LNIAIPVTAAGNVQKDWFSESASSVSACKALRLLLCGAIAPLGQLITRLSIDQEYFAGLVELLQNQQQHRRETACSIAFQIIKTVD
jgi:hypothetical protein